MIIESLVEKKRIPAYAKDKVISLGDIAVYTNETEIPLYKVLNGVKAKEGGEKVTLDLSRANPEELRAYLAEVLPEFDRERVYPTDIKRLLNWYNLLLSVGITDFDPAKEEAEKENAEPEETEAREEAKKTPKTPAAAAVKNTSVTRKNVTAKPSVGKTTQRTRQK
jgi:hypothetical protein